MLKLIVFLALISTTLTVHFSQKRKHINKHAQNADCRLKQFLILKIGHLFSKVDILCSNLPIWILYMPVLARKMLRNWLSFGNLTLLNQIEYFQHEWVWICYVSQLRSITLISRIPPFLPKFSYAYWQLDHCKILMPLMCFKRDYWKMASLGKPWWIL